MTRKSALYALTIAILMGSMAVVALADGKGMISCGKADASVSSHPEQGVDQPNAGEIRDPTGTGAIPDPSKDSPVLFMLIIPVPDEEPAGEIRDPMGTGAIPDPSKDSPVLFMLIIPVPDEEPSAEPLPADQGPI